MSGARILHFKEIQTIDRGGGIYSTPLILEATGASSFSSGMTTFPPGASIAEHTHNTDE